MPIAHSINVSKAAGWLNKFAESETWFVKGIDAATHDVGDGKVQYKMAWPTTPLEQNVEEYEGTVENLQYACSIVGAHAKSLRHLQLQPARFKTAPLDVLSGVLSFVRIAEARNDALSKIKKHKKVDAKGFAKRIASMQALDTIIRDELTNIDGGILKSILETEVRSTITLWHELYVALLDGYTLVADTAFKAASDKSLDCKDLYDADPIDVSALLAVSNSAKAKEFMQQWQVGRAWNSHQHV